MESLHQKIADQLLPLLPADFEHAWIVIEIEKGSMAGEYWYEKEGKKYQPDTPALAALQLGRLFSALWKSTPGFCDQEIGHCTYHLYANGRFSLDIHYQ